MTQAWKPQPLTYYNSKWTQVILLFLIRGGVSLPSGTNTVLMCSVYAAGDRKADVFKARYCTYWSSANFVGKLGPAPTL